jgi:hypothetical protein
MLPQKKGAQNLTSMLKKNCKRRIKITLGVSKETKEHGRNLKVTSRGERAQG